MRWPPPLLQCCTPGCKVPAARAQTAAGPIRAAPFPRRAARGPQPPPTAALMAAPPSCAARTGQAEGQAALQNPRGSWRRPQAPSLACLRLGGGCAAAPDWRATARGSRPADAIAPAAAAGCSGGCSAPAGCVSASCSATAAVEAKAAWGAAGAAPAADGARPAARGVRPQSERHACTERLQGRARARRVSGSGGEDCKLQVACPHMETLISLDTSAPLQGSVLHLREAQAQSMCWVVRQGPPPFMPGSGRLEINQMGAACRLPPPVPSAAARCALRAQDRDPHFPSPLQAQIAIRTTVPAYGELHRPRILKPIATACAARSAAPVFTLLPSH